MRRDTQTCDNAACRGACATALRHAARPAAACLLPALGAARRRSSSVLPGLALEHHPMQPGTQGRRSAAARARAAPPRRAQACLPWSATPCSRARRAGAAQRSSTGQSSTAPTGPGVLALERHPAQPGTQGRRSAVQQHGPEQHSPDRPQACLPGSTTPRSRAQRAGAAWRSCRMTPRQTPAGGTWQAQHAHASQQAAPEAPVPTA